MKYSKRDGSIELGIGVVISVFIGCLGKFLLIFFLGRDLGKVRE